MPIPDEASRGLLAAFLSEDDLAAEIGVTVRTLRRWRKKREGPDITEIGRRRMYAIAAVRRWLASREQPMVRASRRARGVAHAPIG
jgi:Helix-turn-helix domain